MSYGITHHENRSRHALGRMGASAKSLSRNRKSNSNDEVERNSAGQDRIQEAFELEDLSSAQHGPKLEPTLQDLESDDEKDFGGGRIGSVSTTQSFMLYTPDEERAVISKFDRRLVLFVAFLYMLSFLDRSNIGNARIAGMSKDLHLSSLQFEWLLRAFYITYISFEWMTLLWKVFPAHIYLAVCVASWGLVASLQSLAFSFWSLFILRALLGIGEAAFVGVPFYMSFFFKRDELALRTGLFISAAPLATSFAGSLAWAITKFGEVIPIASWRILFLLEGFPSIVVAVFVYLNIPDNPGTAKYLSKRERRVARLRLRNEKDVMGKGTEKDGLKWKEIRDTIMDPKSYLTALMFFCCNVAFSSLPVFLPTIIEEMGYSALTSQALSAPPYLIAFFTVLLTAFLSDRYRTRSTFVIFHALLASSGYAILAIAGSREASPAWRYVGVYPSTMGFFSAITIIITWTINNQDSDTKKGTGVAMLNYIGQLGPLIGVHLYPDSDQPSYVKGMAICGGFMFAVAALALILRILLIRENRKGVVQEMAVGGEDEGLVGQHRTRKKLFTYMI